MSDPASAGDRPLRLLVVDKVAVLSANRLRWRILGRNPGILLTLLAPTRWYENNVDEPFQNPPDEGYTTILGRVSWPGRELLAVYLTGAIRAIRRSRPDVILLMEESFSLFALQFIILRLFFAPSARFVFYSFNVDSYRRFNYRLDRFYRWLSRFVMKRADAGLCPNQRAADVLRDSTFQGRIIPLFVGVNHEIFTQADRVIARRACGIDERARLVLYAGRLLEQKGVDDLIDAFVIVARERPDQNLRLLIVGSGAWEPELRKRVETHAGGLAIEFRQAIPLDRMPQLMASADIFVLPSRAEWKEQFGRVNAEAMLTGTTIIGSTSGAIPEVIEDGGYIFRAGDVDALVRTLRRTLEDAQDVARRRKRGREIALRRYSVQTFADGVTILLEELGGRSLRGGDA